MKKTMIGILAALSLSVISVQAYAGWRVHNYRQYEHINAPTPEEACKQLFEHSQKLNVASNNYLNAVSYETLYNNQFTGEPLNDVTKKCRVTSEFTIGSHALHKGTYTLYFTE